MNTYQFRIKTHDDTRKWEDIPIDHEANFNDGMEAGAHALTDILGDDKKRETREIRYNCKGSLQGHYIAGFSRLTHFYYKTGRLSE